MTKKRSENEKIPKNEPLVCEHCEGTFAGEGNLKSHQNTKIRCYNKDMICYICLSSNNNTDEYVFTNSKNLTDHINKSHNGNFNICNEICKQFIDNVIDKDDVDKMLNKLPIKDYKTKNLCDLVVIKKFENIVENNKNVQIERILYDVINKVINIKNVKFDNVENSNNTIKNVKSDNIESSNNNNNNSNNTYNNCTINNINNYMKEKVLLQKQPQNIMEIKYSKYKYGLIRGSHVYNVILHNIENIKHIKNIDYFTSKIIRCMFNSRLDKKHRKVIQYNQDTKSYANYSNKINSNGTIGLWEIDELDSNEINHKYEQYYRLAFIELVTDVIYNVIGDANLGKKYYDDITKVRSTNVKINKATYGMYHLVLNPINIFDPDDKKREHDCEKSLNELLVEHAELENNENVKKDVKPNLMYDENLSYDKIIFGEMFDDTVYENYADEPNNIVDQEVDEFHRKQQEEKEKQLAVNLRNIGINKSKKKK